MTADNTSYLNLFSFKVEQCIGKNMEVDNRKLICFVHSKIFLEHLLCARQYAISWNYDGVKRGNVPAQKNLHFTEEDQQLNKQS